jgi:formylglycine-generating enzyme required for sulfatase activity
MAGASNESPTPTRLRPGSTFAGRYQIVRPLGRGGMGAVYLARDNRLDRDVALKLPYLWGDEDSEFLHRFQREARAAAGLRHPNICPVYDVGEHEGQPFLVMAYIEGELLSDHLKKRTSPMEPQEALRLVRKLAQAMRVAHERGIIHRDLKPANIMLDLDAVPIVMDFGLARREDREESVRTQSGQQMGTPPYMPLEQFEGKVEKVGIRSDIYSLGVILFELLSGRRPYEGNVLQIYAQLQRADPPTPSSFRPGLESALDLVCRKAMAKEPGDRFSTMGEFDEALREIANPRQVQESPPVPATELSRPPGDERDRSPAAVDVVHEEPPARRMRKVWALPVVAAAPLLILGLFLWSRRPIVNEPGPPLTVAVNEPGPPSTAVTTSDSEKAGTVTRLASRIPVEVDQTSPSPPVNIPPKVENASKAVSTKPEGPLPKKAEPSPTTPPASPREPVAAAPRGPVPEPAIPPREIMSKATGMVLMRIDPGEFLMGSTDSDKEAEADEKPAHRVRITRPFYLGRDEVTVGQFRRFMAASGYRSEAERDGKGGWGWNEAKKLSMQNLKYSWRDPGFPQTDEHPVVNVSWNDAVAFCEWLGKADSRVYRLPTEAEWEYACRAGTKTRYWSGDSAETLATAGNLADASARRKYLEWTTISGTDGFVYTAPVGQFRANAFGIHDMHGNVWEWCGDGYAGDYYKESPPADPPGPSQAPFRVVRGGSCFGNPHSFRSACRGKHPPDYRFNFLGFRIVQVPAHL